MKLTCARTGIRFTCDVGFGSARLLHPIFQLSLDDLLKSHLPAYTTGNLDESEIHLFGSALLAKLPVDRWEVSLDKPAKLLPVWHHAIKRMCYIADRLYSRKTDSLPRYRVAKQNSDLSNLTDYLTALDGVIKEFAWNAAEAAQIAGQAVRTDKIHRLLRDAELKIYNRDSYKLPTLLANWAAVAGEFPMELVSVSVGTDGWIKKMPTREYWKLLIARCCSWNSKDNILSTDTNIGDLEDLIEWCETKIPYGSLHTDTLLRHLRNAKEILTEFKPAIVRPNLNALLADLARHSGEQKLAALSAGATAETGVVVDSNYVMPAPQKPGGKPARNEFPSAAAYLKAQLQWQNAVTAYASYMKSQVAATDTKGVTL